MYFKFFRKERWRKNAPQMTGERVFRGDLLSKNPKRAARDFLSFFT